MSHLDLALGLMTRAGSVEGVNDMAAWAAVSADTKGI